MSRGESEKAELRGMIDKDLMVCLDAIAMANGQSVIALVAGVLDGYVSEKLHEVSVIHRTLQGNPLLTESERTSRGV